MRISRTEVNLRRLLAAAPKQQNQTKLVHYIATLREQLEQLESEISDGVSSISKVKLNEYSEKIETLAASLIVPVPHQLESIDVTADTSKDGCSSGKDLPITPTDSPPGLRRRSHKKFEEKTTEITEVDQVTPVKLDALAQTHIEKHRKLQENLTDEMVSLARQLKESSLMMSQSVQNTKKILDSTESAVGRSLASTGRANSRAAEMYSESIKTSCFTWLIILLMTFIFVMVVLLIRVT